MQIAMLGPLEVRADSGEPVEVGGARLRALVILLALDPGRVVTTSRLLAGLWGDDPPAGAANALQALVSRLRRAVPDIAVESRPAGYRLAVPADAVDVPRFERLAAAGRAQLPRDPAQAAGTLRAALDLWRGPALADVADADFARAPIARLTELRLTTIQDRIEADLRLGAGPALVAELEELVAAHPLREPLIGALMRALAAAGRPSAALTGYERARGRLAEELGVDPSPGLAALHLALLRGELEQSPAAAAEPAGRRPADPSAADPTDRTGADRTGADRAGTHPTGAGGTGPTGLARIADRTGVDRIGADRTGAGRIGAGRIGAGRTGAGRIGAGRTGPDRTGSSPTGGRGRTRNNLRTELTSFVGRADEAGRVGKLLEESRLVTLTGVGGAGKTRLAVEAAKALLDQTPDGVWLVELAPVTDPAEVPQAALAALGLREHALMGRARMRSTGDLAADPLGRLAAGLASKQLLLVLDNCEHLIEAAAAVADRILGDCSGVRILATSREPLGITGETLWPVEPLALPAADADPATALDFPAVQLLADRAAAVRPGFVVDDRNAAAVVRICRALDGMPLAIELAAARLRAMTPAQVAARLDDRFRLLTGGSRTALPRHRTLQAVVDWSWELLDPAERALWRRLAVFAGGATAAAAEQVCAGDPVPADEVADLLTALVDKSLLVPTGRDEPRYRMLETIRAYGLDRLADAGERDRVRAAHAAYFRELAETAEPRLQAHDQLFWLARLSDEHDNLHAAVHSAIGARDAPTAVRLVAALGWYWWLRGHRAEATELARAALALPGEVRAAHRAVASAWGAMNVFGSGQDQGVALDWLRSAGAAGADADPSEHPMLRLLGPMLAMFETANEDRAMVQLRALYDDADPWVAAIARVMYGAVAVNLGRGHDGVEADCQAALDRFGAIGERWGMSLTHAILGQLTGLSGDHAAAAAHFERALTLVAELGAEEDMPQIGTALVHELWLLGETDRAREVLADARRRAEQVGMPESLAAVDYVDGELARRTGDLAAARPLLDRAAATAQAPGVARQWRAGIAGARASLDVAAGDLAAARVGFAAALSEALASVDAPVIAQVLIGVAGLAIRTGDPVKAAVLLGATEAILGLPEPSLLDRPEAVAAARDALGEAAFAEAYRSGCAATTHTVWDLAGLAPEPTTT